MREKEMALGAVPEITHEPAMDGFKHSVDFQEGLEISLLQAERGEGMSIEEARRLVREWVRK